MSSDRRPDADHDAVCASAARHRLVVAPPGTGKTHLAIRLASSLIPALPASPDPGSTVGARVLVLTFSNEARTQLEREAARQLDRAERDRVTISNYHGLFWGAVQAHRRALGLPLQLDLVRASRRYSALASADAAAVARLKKHPGLLEAFAEQAVPQFRDHRSPDTATIDRLLAGMVAEQQAGRLVFDDLGALFWGLLDRFPAIEAAYRARYPIVVADEHQDASALQDGVVRRLATHTLVVLADPMQLIHGFRGAHPDRIAAHEAECEAQFTLRTPHRWHTDPAAGQWLLAVRSRLEGNTTAGNTTAASRPATCRLVRTWAERGFNATLAPIKQAITSAFTAGATRVAVLAYTNTDVKKIRNHLSRNGFSPLQAAGSIDFDDARADIDTLSGLTDTHQIAQHLLTRLAALVPSLPPTVPKQVSQRLRPTGVHSTGCGAGARPILAAIETLYREGPGSYFATLVAALDACAEAGHHIPQAHTLAMLRATAASAPTGEFIDALTAYAECSRGAAQRSARERHGLYVMTTHQSKGKEFDAVVLTGLTDSSFPDTLDGRHLFYVALTRGRSRWFLIAPASSASPLINQV